MENIERLGSDDKNSDIYANIEKINEVVGKINTVSTTNVSSAQASIEEATNELTSVNGFSEYVATIDESAYDSYFDTIKELISQLATKLQENAATIKAADESSTSDFVRSGTGSSTGNPIGSTTSTKEIIVMEALGDGVVSVYSWRSDLFTKVRDDNKVESIKEEQTLFAKQDSSKNIDTYFVSDEVQEGLFSEDGTGTIVVKKAENNFVSNGNKQSQPSSEEKKDTQKPEENSPQAPQEPERPEESHQTIEVPQNNSSETFNGGGTSGGENYSQPQEPAPQEPAPEEPTPPQEPTPEDNNPEKTSVDDSAINSPSSIDEIIKGSKYTKIPTSTEPITNQKTSSGKSPIIPIAAGISAAAAAGIGAKVYLDSRKNNDTEEDDDFETEEWNGDDEAIDISYDDNNQQQEYLDEDNYSYTEEPTEKYDARKPEALADVQ